MSLGKSSTNNSSQNQSQSSSTTTPNNLSALNTGWNAVNNLLSGTNGNSTANANAGLNLIMNGANNTSTAANNGLNLATNYATPGGTTNAANQYLTPTASGANIGNNNPDYQNIVNQLSNSVQASTDGGFAAAGRYGSGADANAFNTALTNEAGQLGYTNYNQSVQNQLNAAGQLSSNNTNSTNSALAALGLVPGLGAATTNAGNAAYTAGTDPTNAYANILSLLGAGGSTTTGTASGTSSGSSSTLNGSLTGSSIASNSGLGNILSLLSKL